MQHYLALDILFSIEKERFLLDHILGMPVLGAFAPLPLGAQYPA